EPETGAARKILLAGDYISGGNVSALGLALDRDRRMYVVVNQADSTTRPEMNRVTIFRTAPSRDSDPAAPKAWLKTEYPYGIDTFNHGVSCIAQGPDGFIYVSSGSRTDHGERGNDPKRSTVGEVELTSCIWRLDPR